jgi:hypothetical protein
MEPECGRGPRTRSPGPSPRARLGPLVGQFVPPRHPFPSHPGAPSRQQRSCRSSASSPGARARSPRRRPVRRACPRARSARRPRGAPARPRQWLPQPFARYRTLARPGIRAAPWRALGARPVGLVDGAVAVDAGCHHGDAVLAGPDEAPELLPSLVSGQARRIGPLSHDEPHIGSVAVEPAGDVEHAPPLLSSRERLDRLDEAVVGFVQLVLSCHRSLASLQRASPAARSARPGDPAPVKAKSGGEARSPRRTAPTAKPTGTVAAPRSAPQSACSALLAFSNATRPSSLSSGKWRSSCSMTWVKMPPTSARPAYL